jgi:hypothetical protein
MTGATGVYLYGVTKVGDQLALDEPPISGPGPVYTISHGGLAAVVSDGVLPRYELTRRNIRGHETVVEAVMRTSDILPAPMGVVMPSPASVVAELLDKRHDELDCLLARVCGRVEFGLKVSWTDLRRVFREIVAGDPSLRAHRDRLGRSPGAVTYKARMSLGDQAARALEEKRAREADELVAALEAHASGVRRNDPVGELMVLNSAFLIERARVAKFEAAVACLDGQDSERLGFLLAGPLPPYNFVSLHGERRWDS